MSPLNREKRCRTATTCTLHMAAPSFPHLVTPAQGSLVQLLPATPSSGPAPLWPLLRSSVSRADLRKTVPVSRCDSTSQEWTVAHFRSVLGPPVCAPDYPHPVPGPTFQWLQFPLLLGLLSLHTLHSKPLCLWQLLPVTAQAPLQMQNLNTNPETLCLPLSPIHASV